MVLPHLEENTIELCSLSHSLTSASRGSPTTALIDECQQINVDYPNAVSLCTSLSLGLPELVPNMETVMASCRGEPTPYSETYRLPNSPPFRPRSEDAIIKFDLALQVEGPGPFAQPISLSFVVHRSALLAQFIEQRKHVSEGAETLSVPWREWGPRICSWFVTNDLSSRWITTTCGQRWVTTANGESSIYIRDFNPANIRRVTSMLGEATWYETDTAIITLVDSPLPIVIRFDDGAEGHITSNLPYLEIQTKEKFNYTSVFMSENNLLGVNVRLFCSVLLLNKLLNLILQLDRTTGDMSTVDIFSMVE